MAIEPDAEAAQAAQAEIDVLGAGTEPKLVMGLVDGGKRLFGRGDDAEHGVGVAGDELGRGLDRYIDPMREWLEEERRGPGVVEDHHDARVVGGLGDSRYVLHLESLRAWRLGEHDPRLLGDE